jgi:hypothetical protein
MIGVTAFGIFRTPVLSALMRKLDGNRLLARHNVELPILEAAEYRKAKRASAEPRSCLTPGNARRPTGVAAP